MKEIQRDTIEKYSQLTQEMIREANTQMSKEITRVINAHKEEVDNNFKQLIKYKPLYNN